MKEFKQITMAQQTYGEWMRSNPPIQNLTAVEWLIDWLMDNPITSDGYIEAMIKSKQMEKEQIINARLSTFDLIRRDDVLKAEQYYNETYGE